MSFIDNFGMKCNQCGFITYRDKTKNDFDEECKNCGKRMIVQFRTNPNKKRNRPDINNDYANGCTIELGTF
jgi:DNA-directed RNA polymerase subunit RPC12/RpoP